MSYFSFLLCFHADHTDLFLSGRPIGVIRGGVFQLHQIKTPAGNLRDTTLRDLQNLTVDGCPFATLEELQAHVAQAVSALAWVPKTDSVEEKCRACDGEGVFGAPVSEEYVCSTCKGRGTVVQAKVAPRCTCTKSGYEGFPASAVPVCRV